ncbi:MAG: aldehyde ferredoxin oxidoreductase family protein [Candidatus Lokiarchaeota archaeon]|nr:aldehyde ferredoxin oxidoreductase family protein [Candidatus Lokiarchaeota archaeon]
MLKSFRGKILHVDLSKHEISTENLDETIAKDFLGGAGYACRYLFERISKETDPFSPDNILMIMTGPLNGTFAPNTGRWVVCSKSPYTGIWGESNCGSWFGAELKKAGYDGIIIKGASKTPVYLEIMDDDVKLKDATFLWGKGAIYTTKHLKEIFGKQKSMVACIGPAGENLVKYANIVSEERAAGRTGMGAIFGSKKLKAIIVKGSNINLDVYDKERLRTAIDNARNYVKSSFGTQVLGELGTSGALDMYNATGELCIKYFSKPQWEEAYKISGATMAETILVNRRFCHSCVIGCGRRVKIKEGKYQTEEVEGPEYETIVSFGSLILNDNLEAITYLNNKCFDYGIDTISSGGTIACIIHHFENGNINEDDIDGLNPKWGDIKFVEEILEKIVYRKGIGNILAEGSNAFADKFKISREEIATVVGLEVTYHDLRSNYGMAIAYGMGGAYRGPSHNACDPYYSLLGVALEEIGMELVDKYSDGEDMAKYCSLDMDYRALYSSMIMCSFCNPLPSQNAAMIEAATGFKFGIEEVKLYGERILTIKRLFNIKMGLTPKDDRLPRILTRPFSNGGSAGKTPDFYKLKEFFYKYRDWERETGKPSQAKLKFLGLDTL